MPLDNSPDYADQLRDAITDATTRAPDDPVGQASAGLAERIIRQVVRDELASLGGHLLAEAAAAKDVLEAARPLAGAEHPDWPANQGLARLGGYLLATYGKADDVEPDEEASDEPA